jgi:small-conductance mechanosensitive channel
VDVGVVLAGLTALLVLRVPPLGVVAGTAVAGVALAFVG